MSSEHLSPLVAAIVEQQHANHADNDRTNWNHVYQGIKCELEQAEEDLERERQMKHEAWEEHEIFQVLGMEMVIGQTQGQIMGLMHALSIVEIPWKSICGDQSKEE